MKAYVTEILRVFHTRAGQRNVRVLCQYLSFFAGMVALFSVLFHVLMLREGQEHTWLTGVYWTLTVMSTLGFGDITFHSDLGRLFSMLVLLSGMIFLLVLLPFTFIEFFYSPWMRAQSEARAPRELPADTRDHAILTHFGPVTNALITRLQKYDRPYVLISGDLTQALQLHDQGLNVLVGALDEPGTYERARVREAALVVATGADVVNTNITFTVREISREIPIITTASSESAEDILKLAGSSHVLRLDEMMGRWLARRTIGGDARAHIIGRFDRLLIAEATAADTPLVGRTLAESRLREMAGITVVGVWERGRFEPARPDTVIGAATVMVLAGSQEQLRRYDELFCIYNVATAPVLIVGGGKVGRATGRALERRSLEYRIIDHNSDHVGPSDKYIFGNAATIGTLERAGIAQAPAVIITTHDDDTNVYLTILCRRLRPDILLISRATLERNVSTLHRAGADFVMSYASMGANVAFNLLRHTDVLLVAEGLNVFRVKVPPSLAGQRISETTLRLETGCSIVAVGMNGELQINPDPSTQLMAGMPIVLIGSVDSENQFLELYGKS